MKRIKAILCYSDQYILLQVNPDRVECLESIPGVPHTKLTLFSGKEYKIPMSITDLSKKLFGTTETDYE